MTIIADITYLYILEYVQLLVVTFFKLFDNYTSTDL